MSTSLNPYSPPPSSLAPSSPEAVDPAVEAIRREHLNAEGNIKGIGALFVLASVFVVIASIAPLLDQKEHPITNLADLIPAAFLLVIAVLQGFVGVGIRQLRPWARFAGLVLTLPGLLGFPVGTVISLIVMVSLLTKRARMVFSPEYKAVIAATPHIKYQSRLLRIFFMLVVAIIVLVIVGAFFIQLSHWFGKG